MKLITEQIEDVKILTEEKDGKKDTKVKDKPVAKTETTKTKSAWSLSA